MAPLCIAIAELFLLADEGVYKSMFVENLKPQSVLTSLKGVYIQTEVFGVSMWLFRCAPLGNKISVLGLSRSA